MNSTQLRLSILFHAEQYAKSRGLEYKKHKTAIIFNRISDNFQRESYLNIRKNKEWSSRLQKPHPQVTGAYEMQSSNSSDALLMNIFCYPKIGNWKGVRDLFKVEEISPNFGFKPGIPLKNGGRDRTELDLVFEDIFAEAKLTESDFTQKDLETVKNYRDLKEVFHFEKLPRANNEILNYQILRNVLAAFHLENRLILICDDRRGDLIKSYYDVVKCIKSVEIRKRCDIIFWQDIWRKVGKNLKEFLSEKYGIGANNIY
jgi:hypothetical protein